MLGRPVLFVLALTGLVAGCAARPDPPDGPRPSRAGAPDDLLAAPWILVAPDAPRVQRLELAARLLTEMGPAVREDSIQSSLTVAWAAVPESLPRRWSGSITDFRVRASPADTARVPEGVLLPVRFRAVAVEGGAQPTFESPAAADCADPAAGLEQGWRELWISPPASLRPGTAWEDSTTYTLCRDGVPLRVETVRSYVAESALMRARVVHVVVVRRARVSLEGTGVQFGDTIHIVGGGSSTVRLLLPLSGGAMTGEGEGVLTLELRGRRRTQRLTQESRLEIHAP